jgi:hypothetical protein
MNRKPISPEMLRRILDIEPRREPRTEVQKFGCAVTAFAYAVMIFAAVYFAIQFVRG